MRLIEWEVAEDGYEEQIIIPKEKRDLAAEEGIGTENKQKVTVQIMNLTTGESYIGRLAITGNHQIYLPNRDTTDAKGLGESPNPDLGRVKNTSGVSEEAQISTVNNADIRNIKCSNLSLISCPTTLAGCNYKGQRPPFSKPSKRLQGGSKFLPCAV